MNSNEKFLENHDPTIEPITVEPEAEESSDETGVGTLAAGVAGAAVGAVIGGRIAGKQGAVIGAVAGAVAGGLAAKATPDDAGEKIKDAAENVADKIQDTAERAKPSYNQDASNLQPKERIVIEGTPDVEPEARLTTHREYFPDASAIPVDYEEISDSEMENQFSFMRKADRR